MKLRNLLCFFLLAVAAGCASTVAGRADAAGTDAPGTDALGVDASCAAGQLSCGGRCANPASDPAHCGACGRTCPMGADCVAGACATACAAAFTRCGAACADLRTDGSHCGACDVACAAGRACSGGVCRPACAPPRMMCGAAPSSACADTASDPSHCGACGRACPAVPGAAAICAFGTCGLTCDAGFADCDALTATGCEADLSSTGHCGGCGRACLIGESCVAGACVCPPGRRVVAGACVVDTAPRPVAPVSLGDVTQRRPTLRWVLAPGYDGAVVELCRDRACTALLETLTVRGSSARPTSDLPAHSVVFWRLRGRIGTTTDAFYGPTWLFHVPAVSAPGGRDASAHAHLDVNGDGFDDLVVGAQFASPGGRHNAGTVSVFYGSATWTPSPPGTPLAPDRLLEGAAADDLFGNSVAGVGDVNGDGYADIVVGAYHATPRGLFDMGTASVFLGSATWTPSPPGTPRAPDCRLEGNARADNFGFDVAGAGDINGDGYADIVVGAPLAGSGGLEHAGTASVFLGSATWSQGDRRMADRVFGGAAELDHFGWSVAGVGDVNGDGFDDLVVGAPSADPGGRSEAGNAGVFYGSATWTPSPLGTARAPDRLFEGAAEGDSFGNAVAGARDVNGDGFDDLIVGAYRASPGGRAHAGTASVFHGSATWTPRPSGTARDPDRLFEGAAEDNWFGFSVADAGDIDGDSHAELVVGAYCVGPIGRVPGNAVNVFRWSAARSPSWLGTARSGMPHRWRRAARLRRRVGGLASEPDRGDRHGVHTFTRSRAWSWSARPMAARSFRARHRFGT